MQALVNALRFIVTILPAIVELVKALEHTLPLRKIGPDKLQLLKDLVTDVYQSIADDAKKGLPLEGLLRAAAAVANRFVAFFNKVGWPVTS